MTCMQFKEVKGSHAAKTFIRQSNASPRSIPHYRARF
jgi:hypothetical protein